MILFDATKTGQASHRSGLTRVSERLRAALGDSARTVSWDSWDKTSARRDDWFFTSELFSEPERPGFTAFLERRPCRLAALFHDAIPLKRPDTTWPQSVARHPGYMKLLARFDRVWAVSKASRADLLAFWRWQRVENPPPVEVLQLGSDFDGSPRRRLEAPPPGAVVVCLGIVEPRKNQSLLLDLCPPLWDAGTAFELHVAGRVNPHFGRPIAERLRSLSRSYPQLHFHEGPSDAVVADLLGRARLTVFPTLAEGCGLPLLESLWRGVPCLASDLPPLRENAVGGGCLCVRPDDTSSWSFALSHLVARDDLWRKLAADASRRPLPTWADAADVLRAALR